MEMLMVLMLMYRHFAKNIESTLKKLQQKQTQLILFLHYVLYGSKKVLRNLPGGT